MINADILMLTGLAFILTLSVIQQMEDLRKVREEGQRAVDLSEAKTKFLASMSHEIRTPINAILGMNEMILRENKDPAIREYASSAKSSGEMLLMLVNDVLDFSKIEAGKMEITNARFEFSSLLRNIMPMLKERADEKNIELKTEIKTEIPNGQISDEFRIRQILINLINNAVKYTDTGSVILELSGSYTAEDSFRLKMNVKDTGRGIKEEDQKHLFEAFTRADIKKNRSIEGTGLGLAIVKRIVDSMEGSIEVKSKYGEGSEFIVELPVGVADRTPLPEDYYAHMEDDTAGSRKCDFTAPEAAILVVDDNNSNLKIAKLFLKRAEIVPELCSSGGKAVELCRKKRYDLIFLDHMMPDPDGIRTLSIIKREDASLNKDTPAVVLTANAVAGSRKTYMDAGFVDYLTKPIDASLLEETVQKYLPADKILKAAEKDAPSDGEAVSSTETDASRAEPAVSSAEPVTLRERLEKIEGLDYDAAMSYMGDDEELFAEIVGIIAAECDEKIDEMRKCIASGDWDGYQLTAHSIKSLMASVGLMELSERAKKHEFAAKGNDTEFILSDCEAFFASYRNVCSMLA